MSLRLVPIDFTTADGFVREHHRTHPFTPASWKFGVGVCNEGLLVGVAMVGRPSARSFDNGDTVEVTRTCTDGYRNANSMLYGAVARAAFALGYRRVVTYTQQGESGASLRAAGWRVVAERPARKGWDMPSRRREDRGTGGIPRTLWEVPLDNLSDANDGEEVA